ncbi:MAG: methyltransferase domain-containing protein, partial [Acidimicrobiia bacterium]
RYTGLEADLICCRHTLEHIPDVAHFVGLTKLAADNVAGSAVCFEIPEMMRILREGAFWDIFHEHCTYFTPGSLGRVFRSVGFEITDLSVDYDDQYLFIEATPTQNGSEAHPLEETVSELKDAIQHFQSVVSSRIDLWRSILAEAKGDGRRAVLWGSGSKAVAFLNAIGFEDVIEYVVDINPYRHGKFMPGTSQQIVSPDLLKDFRPDLVVLMNPIYEAEVRAQLEGMGLSPEILAV